MQAILDVWEGLLDLVAPRVCGGCDVGLSASQGFCVGCRSLLEPCASGPGVFVFFGPIAQAIHRLKYQGRVDLASALGALVAEASLVHAGEVDVVMPVPLHARRHRERGFNPSALLASDVARALGVPLDVATLRRIRDTSPQVGRDRASRRVNVRGAFAARSLARPLRVLLVDDVFTTGATMQAAEDALRAAGASAVARLTLAASDSV